jgi:hypothetical protein
MQQRLQIVACTLIATGWGLGLAAEAPMGPLNLVGNPGFEAGDSVRSEAWSGTQNAGTARFERSAEQAHSGRWSGKVVCTAADVYARWVQQRPDLFADVRLRDRLRLSFWYRATAALGDALVQIHHDRAPGWRQYTLKRLQATGDEWVLYQAEFTVDVTPNGSGEVQLRGTTAVAGDQVAYFDDVALEVVGHEEPLPGVLSLGPPAGVAGVYHPDGRLTFAERPGARDWEFMATGTGVTGLTVSAPAGLLLQVNHSAAIDEAGTLRALARLHLDLDGSPFAKATGFRMEHDLRRSLITVLAETAEGPVRVEVRAHVPADLIRIDIHDQRRTAGALTVRLEEDAASRLTVDRECGVCFWHENPSEALAANGPETAAGHPMVQAESRDWLAGRVFGLALATGAPAAQVADRTLTLPANSRHTLLLAGVSTTGGWDAFAESARERLAKAAAEGAQRFVETHEAWWRDFWARAAFVPGDTDGAMLRHRAAFDLYRYYLACCGSDRRETPVRFQIDLYRYHTRNFDWLTGLICAVEQYQSFYGAMRTGDWAPLRGLASFYARNLPYYRQVARRIYGHAGARIPMWQTPVVLRPAVESPAADPPPTGVPNARYNGENAAGQIWLLWLLCDYVDISGDHDFGRLTLRPLAIDLVEFIRLQYPRRENGRMVIAPCNAGETWQGVRDPAEMVCALRVALPRLLAIARSEDWPAELVHAWDELAAAVPEVPRGRLEYQGPAVLPVIGPGDQLVPAADMSTCQAYVLPWSNNQPWYQLNAQHTELYALWPARLTPRDDAERDSAVRSYRDRLFQHHWDGWNLDVVFAACLGLQEEVAQWFGPHFDRTFVLPCGLARETAPENPSQPGIPDCPSLQGLGTGVLPVLEMLLQDTPGELVVLPCWPAQVPVDFTLYSPFAGRVEVHYVPNGALRVLTERPIRVRTGIRDPSGWEVLCKQQPG